MGRETTEDEEDDEGGRRRGPKDKDVWTYGRGRTEIGEDWTFLERDGATRGDSARSFVAG